MFCRLRIHKKTKCTLIQSSVIGRKNTVGHKIPANRFSSIVLSDCVRIWKSSRSLLLLLCCRRLPIVCVFVLRRNVDSKPYKKCGYCTYLYTRWKQCVFWDQLRKSINLHNKINFYDFRSNNNIFIPMVDLWTAPPPEQLTMNELKYINVTNSAMLYR